jgi:spore coat polysaccharide biosynthesis protein SpsF (cytidylyltransferase family)
MKESDKMTKSTVIIQARTGSSRFPQKVLEKIDGNYMIWHVINRIKQVQSVDQIVLATTCLDEDKILLKIAKDLDILNFSGDENNVLNRFYSCANEIKGDPIIRITGDCPLIDPFLVDEMLKFFLNHDFDYISNRIIPTYPDGLDVEIFSFSALKICKSNSTLNSELEHVTPYIIKNPKKFKLFNFKNKTNISNLRWCVDEKQDLKFVKKIYEKLKPNLIFSMDDVLNILKNYPQLLKINDEIIRDEGYLKSLQNDFKNNNIC